MATRRPHTKSRLGCTNCKVRKVKCDQAAPTCGHCARRREECSLTEVHLHIARSAPIHVKSSPATNISETPHTNGYNIHHAGPSYTALDLELVHWYSTETWNQLQHRMEASDLWRGPLFELALEKPAFMDAILTTAAIHRLVTQPSLPNRAAYVDLIMRKGMNIIPQIVENLSSPSKDNCILLVASTILLAIWAFGSTHLPPQANLFGTPEFSAQAPSPVDLQSSRTQRLDELLTVMTISTGSYVVVMTLSDEIKQRGFGGMIRGTPWNTLGPPAAHVVHGLEALEAHCKALSGELQLDVKEEYLVQIKRLYEMFQASEAGSDEFDSVVGFAIRLPKAMIAEAAQRKPLMLTILAYWTAALQAVDRTWWIRGWPRAVFEEISTVLDADWRIHLRVPATYFN